MGTVWAEQQVALAVHCPQQIVELEIRLHGCKSSPLVHLPTQEIDLQYCSNRKVGYRLCSRRQKILTSFRFWNFSARSVNSFSSAPVSVWLGEDPRGSLGGFSAGTGEKWERGRERSTQFVPVTSCCRCSVHGCFGCCPGNLTAKFP
jgi:hypothetical protein